MTLVIKLPSLTLDIVCRILGLDNSQGHGRKIRRLYELTELHIPQESNICVASTHLSIQLWHRRLAHSSIGYLVWVFMSIHISTKWLCWEKASSHSWLSPCKAYLNILSRSHWGEATLTIVHKINRLPSFVVGNVSPFGRLYLTTQIITYIWSLVVLVLSSFSPKNILHTTPSQTQPATLMRTSPTNMNITI